MNRWYIMKRYGIALLTAGLCGALWASGVKAQCRLDWDGDEEISEADYLVGDPMGGYYAEWYIQSYYPSYYPVLFPSGDVDALDYNDDGVLDQDDLMGALNATAVTEGFYVEWYIYMFYPAYYPIFFPEYVADCDRLGIVDSPAALPDAFYHTVAGEWFNVVSRDGTILAGAEVDSRTAFVVSTTDFVAMPGSKANYEYLIGETVYEVVDISNDNNIILARIRMNVDGKDMDGGAFYNRSTGVWTHLGAPEAGIDFGSCSFYPSAEGMSADGSKIVGTTATLAEPCRTNGFLYDTVTDTWTILGGVEPSRPILAVKGCNKDASLVFGVENREPLIVDGEIIYYGGEVPILWTLQSDGSYDSEWLGLQPPGEILASDHKGDYLVGSDDLLAYIWDAAGDQLVNVGNMSGRQAAPFAVSDGGEVVLGAHKAGAGMTDAFVRREGYNAGQMTLLKTYFNDHGITDLMNLADGQGNFIGVPLSVSSDGKVMVGHLSGVALIKYSFLAIVK